MRLVRNEGGEGDVVEECSEKLVFDGEWSGMKPVKA